MKYLLFLFVLKSVLSANTFWTIDDYVHNNPSQKLLMQQFEKVVQAKAVPLNKVHKKVKISILYPGNQITDYWKRSQKSFEARMQELNIKYEIEAVFVDENDVKTLQKRLKELLQEENDYLLFTLNIDGHKKLISQIISQEKPKLILQNITTPLKEWGDNQPFMYVGFDHIEGTKLLAQHYKTKFPKGATYLMLYHNQGYVSQMRGDSFIGMFNDPYKLDGSFYTYVNKEVAKKIVLEYNNINNIDFIYNCSTDIAIGASEALDELNLQKEVLLNGWGGGSTELDMIENKKLDVTVMRMNDDNGVAMAEAIKFDLLQEATPLIYSGKFEIVDTSTSKEHIQELKERAFRYSK
ncbi:MAG: substrate-binding domain-containing protein [Arcobacteraceae bacterium]|nr:substrate-binding domain-containing protein [Arcobacteraceae bacterium]